MDLDIVLAIVCAERKGETPSETYTQPDSLDIASSEQSIRQSFIIHSELPDRAA